MTNDFYPAIHLGDFPDARSALASVGVTGSAAKLCIEGFDTQSEGVAAYQAHMIGVTRGGSKPVLVLTRLDNGQTRLGIGVTDLPSNSEAGAIARVVDTLARAGHPDGDGQRFFAYQWPTPRTAMQ